MLLDENKFVDEVWNKYRKYYEVNNKDKNFFDKKIVRTTNYLLYVKSVSLCLAAIIVTAIFTGGVYAGIKAVINSNIEYTQKDSTIKNSNSLGAEYVEDMIYIQEYNIHYKKISTYEEYKKYKETYNNFIEMREKDFTEYFVIVFLGDNFGKSGLYIDSINVTDDTIHIDISKKEEKDNALVFARILKENDREKIEIKFHEKEPNMTNYINRQEIPENYSKEKAVEDNCVVIEDSKYIARSEGLKEFVQKTEKGINDNIRIVEYYNSMGLIVTDIEFKDGEYIVCSDYTRYDNPGGKYYYKYLTSDKIEFTEPTGKYGEVVMEEYTIIGKYGEQVGFIINR